MRTRLMSALLASLLAGGAMAQENDETPVETLDLTMELMPEGATQPDAVTRIIELPAAAAEAARENAARGLDTANAAREARGDGNGSVAEEASERGLERAQQVREDIGRGRPDGAGPPEDLAPTDLPGDGPGGEPGDGPGGGPPDNPGPPETPGPPGD